MTETASWKIYRLLDASGYLKSDDLNMSQAVGVLTVAGLDRYDLQKAKSKLSQAAPSSNPLSSTFCQKVANSCLFAA